MNELDSSFGKMLLKKGKINRVVISEADDGSLCKKSFVTYGNGMNFWVYEKDGVIVNIG